MYSFSERLSYFHVSSDAFSTLITNYANALAIRHLQSLNKTHRVSLCKNYGNVLIFFIPG